MKSLKRCTVNNQMGFGISHQVLKGLQGFPIVKVKDPPLEDIWDRVVYWEEEDEEGEIILLSNLDSDFVSRFIKASYPNHDPLDAYGGCNFTLEGKRYRLLNTYGDEGEYTDRLMLCICILHGVEYIEALDCILEGDRLLPYRLWGAEVPLPVRGESLGVGKRGFYLYRNDKEVSLKVSKGGYLASPEGYKHGGVSEFISSPRVRFDIELINVY